MKKLMMMVLGLTCAIGMAGMAVAGSVDSPGAPGSAASKMPAVGDIYNYLTTGTPAPTPGTSFTEPSSGPASTGHTLTEIYAAVATPFPQCDATTADVQSGKKFFCTVAGSWGVKTGGMTTDGSLIKTGQTSSYQTGDDGYYQKGRAFNYSWGANNDTVLDNVTGLMWASNNAGAGGYSTGSLVWSSAVDWAEGLTFAGYSDWRLPNYKEWDSIHEMDARPEAQPKVNRTYFINFGGDQWVSSTCAAEADTAYYACIRAGYIWNSPKTSAKRVIVVRGGQ